MPTLLQMTLDSRIPETMTEVGNEQQLRIYFGFML